MRMSMMKQNAKSWLAMDDKCIVYFSFTGGLVMNKLLIGVLFLGLVSGACSPTRITADGQEVRGRLFDLGNGICEDTFTGQMWQQGQSKRVKSLDEANNYVKMQDLGGYTDWRLPTVAELYDLHLAFDIHNNGNCELKSEGNYWSGEPDSEGRVGAWEMDDNCDPERQYAPKKVGRIRVIRDVK